MIKGEKVADNDNEARKYRNWRAWYKEKGLAGLIFHSENKGNRTQRLDSRVLGELEVHIKGTDKWVGVVVPCIWELFVMLAVPKVSNLARQKNFGWLFMPGKGPGQTERIR